MSVLRAGISNVVGWGDTANQSEANNFFDEQIGILILFARNILYKYENEYYSEHLWSRIQIIILFGINIEKYI